MSALPEYTQEQAFAVIVRWMREQPNEAREPGTNCDLDLRGLLLKLLVREHGVNNDNSISNAAESVSPPFSEAAWQMCRRGILRPGPRQFERNVGSPYRYTLTTRGREWLQTALDHGPLEVGTLSRRFEEFSDRFGPGYRERSQDAIRAYDSGAYLACCAMCGAAAESIILRLAIAKEGSEERVLDLYMAKDGRRKVESLLVGQHDKAIKESFSTYAGLLAYWRDAASHGPRLGIDEPKAHESLRSLLRFGQFAIDRWDVLTQSSARA